MLYTYCLLIFLSCVDVSGVFVGFCVSYTFVVLIFGGL